MKKIFLIPIFCFLSVFAIFNNSASLFNDSSKSCFTNQSLILSGNNTDADSVIAILLYEDIDKAIQDYYGTPTQFALYDAKIIEISQIDSKFSYRVTIEVRTFHGAHNSPYGLEILTFTVSPVGSNLESYVHKSLPD